MYPKPLTDRITVLGNHYLQTYLVSGDDMSILIEPGISATASQVVRQMRSVRIDPLKVDWICPGHCGVYAGEAARRFIDQSRAEIEWVRHSVTEGFTGPDAGDGLQESLFERYFVREATMFSEHSTRYCMDLIIRRIMDATSKTAGASSSGRTGGVNADE